VNNHQGNQNHQGNHDHHDNRGKHKKVMCHTETCEKITTTVPVKVKAHAHIGDVVLKCMEKRVVKEHDKPKNVVKIEIMQEIFAKIPIDFIAEVEVEDENVDFDAHECN